MFLPIVENRFRPNAISLVALAVAVLVISSSLSVKVEATQQILTGGAGDLDVYIKSTDTLIVVKDQTIGGSLWVREESGVTTFHPDLVIRVEGCTIGGYVFFLYDTAVSFELSEVYFNSNTVAFSAYFSDDGQLSLKVGGRIEIVGNTFQGSAYVFNSNENNGVNSLTVPRDSLVLIDQNTFSSFSYLFHTDSKGTNSLLVQEGGIISLTRNTFKNTAAIIEAGSNTENSITIQSLSRFQIVNNTFEQTANILRSATNGAQLIFSATDGSILELEDNTFDSNCFISLVESGTAKAIISFTGSLLLIKENDFNGGHLYLFRGRNSGTTATNSVAGGSNITIEGNDFVSGSKDLIFGSGANSGTVSVSFSGTGGVLFFNDNKNVRSYIFNGAGSTFEYQTGSCYSLLELPSAVPFTSPVDPQFREKLCADSTPTTTPDSTTTTTFTLATTLTTAAVATTVASTTLTPVTLISTIEPSAASSATPTSNPSGSMTNTFSHVASSSSGYGSSSGGRPNNAFSFSSSGAGSRRASGDFSSEAQLHQRSSSLGAGGQGRTSTSSASSVLSSTATAIAATTANPSSFGLDSTLDGANQQNNDGGNVRAAPIATDSGGSTGVIIAVLVAVVLIVLIVVGGVVFARRRGRSAGSRETEKEQSYRAGPPSLAEENNIDMTPVVVSTNEQRPPKLGQSVSAVQNSSHSSSVVPEPNKSAVAQQFSITSNTSKNYPSIASTVTGQSTINGQSLGGASSTPPNSKSTPLIDVLDPSAMQEMTLFRKGRLIGAGGFGKVYLGLNEKDGSMLAAKEIIIEDQDVDKRNKTISLLAAEIENLQRLDHPNIVKYIGCEQAGDGGEAFYILMEWMSAGSLLSTIKSFGKLTPRISARYTRNALEGLVYLHDEGFIHRDIKAANMLLGNDGALKLSDLGSAQNVDSAHSLRGTALWLAPECMIKSEKSDRQASSSSLEVGPPSDIWSLGCTVMEMLTGEVPFAWLQLTQFGIMGLVSSGGSQLEEVLNEIPERVKCPEGADFILSCLKSDPTERPTARDLLIHPFLEQEVVSMGRERGLSNSVVFTRNRTSSQITNPAAPSSLGRSFQRTENSSFSSPKKVGEFLSGFSDLTGVTNTLGADVTLLGEEGVLVDPLTKESDDIIIDDEHLKTGALIADGSAARFAKENGDPLVEELDHTCITLDLSKGQFDEAKDTTTTTGGIEGTKGEDNKDRSE